MGPSYCKFGPNPTYFGKTSGKFSLRISGNFSLRLTDVQILMDDHTIMVYRKGDLVIELDKEKSVYTPTLQRVVDPKKNIAYQINQAYYNNPWNRSGSVYDSVIQGGG